MALVGEPSLSPSESGSSGARASARVLLPVSVQARRQRREPWELLPAPRRRRHARRAARAA
eukprot:2481559-Prymnesium_polylepis.1